MLRPPSSPLQLYYSMTLHYGRAETNLHLTSMRHARHWVEEMESRVYLGKVHLSGMCSTNVSTVSIFRRQNLGLEGV